MAGNEARARLENESSGDWFESHARVVFVCECYDPECDAMISLTRAEYEHVRASPTTFAIRPGHVEPDVEYVAARHDTHWVTEKGTPDGARVARDTDSRS